MANKKYKLSDGNSWATDGIFDFGQNKTQRQINSDLNGAINNVQGQITANIQKSTTASKEYSVGDYLVLNGSLCRVTQKIANGGTIKIGTNVQSTDIGEQFKNKQVHHGSYNSSIISSTDGTPNSGSVVRLSYYDDFVNFSARILLQNLTQGVRPVITITHNDFIECPSFECVGNPVLRGTQGNYSDECFASHVKGQNTIGVYQYNFLSNSVTLQAGWGLYQIPGTSVV